MNRSVSIKRALVGLALLLPLLALSLAWPHFSRAPAKATTATVSVAVPPKAAIVDAATGVDSGDMSATGTSAQMINAALPFIGGPNPKARSFAMSSGSESFARAHLCLTQAVYYEAGFEPVPGRRAVAQVVLNRVKHPAFPASVCGVVYEGAKRRVCQFSFTCDGSLDRQPAKGAWDRAKQVAAAALGGHVEASVGTATHYHADYVAPKWAPMLAKIDKIGAHIFYRWPGQWGRPVAFTQRYAGEPLSLAALQRGKAPVTQVEMAETVEIEEPVPFPTRAEDPTIRRADNDVGGLVDTSKGWRPSLPDPTKTNSAKRLAEAQERAARPPVPATPVAVLTQGAK